MPAGTNYPPKLKRDTLTAWHPVVNGPVFPLSTLLAETGPRKKAKWIIAEGADAFAMQMSIPNRKSTG